MQNMFQRNTWIISLILHLCTVHVSVGDPKLYQSVAWELTTPQWLDRNTYKTVADKKAADVDETQNSIRYPHAELQFHTTNVNQLLIILHADNHEILPSCSESLRINKTPRRFINFKDYAPSVTYGLSAKHAYAEYLQLRRRNFGSSDELILPFLYLPTGWPIFLVVIYITAIIVVPLLGAFLVNVAFYTAELSNALLWGPVKVLLRTILIQMELRSRRWWRYIAPSHYLETRFTWKLPTILRNDPLEDCPPELAHTPPTNKIDYTMYMLTPEDYDELDLGMDELEFVDEMLLFKDRNPKAVARLLKYRLGLEKFYYYFDDEFWDVDYEDEDLGQGVGLDQDDQDFDGTKEDEEEDENLFIHIMHMDEPWMHDEFDKTYMGFNLVEIRKRREMMKTLKDEITYLRERMKQADKFHEDMTETSLEKRKVLQMQAKKMCERYLKCAKHTREKIDELVESFHAAQKKHELTSKAQALKQLPSAGQSSRFNYRLNLNIQRQRESDPENKNLEIFHYP